MANVPSVAQYGKVRGYFTEALADSNADSGEIPDQRPINGRVELIASPKTIIFAGLDVPQTTVIKNVVIDLVDGHIVPPDAEHSQNKGVNVLATQQPNGTPTTINWTARFSGGISILDDLPFQVPANGSIDLSTLIPSEPEPGTVQVIVNGNSKQDIATLDEAVANHILNPSADSQLALLSLFLTEAQVQSAIESILNSRGTPFAMAAGQANMVFNNAHSGLATIVYPPDTFTVPPIVTATFASTAGDASYILTPRVSILADKDTAQVSIRVEPSGSPVTGTWPINWIAVQMTEFSAES